MGKHFKHPFGQAALGMGAAYFLIDFGIAYIPPLRGIPSAPVPNSVLLQYLLTVGVGVLLWVSDNETRWAEFKALSEACKLSPDKGQQNPSG